MPRGHKSKLRSREKRQQGRSETESPSADQADVPSEDECPSPPVSEGSSPGSPAPDPSRVPQEASAAAPPEEGVLCLTLDEVVQSLDENSTDTPQAAESTGTIQKDRVTRKAKMLVPFLLEKYKGSDRIRQAEMMKVIGRKHKGQFPEVLRAASDRLQVVYGLELKEVDPSNKVYGFINMLNLPSDGSLSREENVPKMGLLMNILSVIFMKGNSASEDDIWRFLNGLGVFPGRRHSLFGDVKKLITKDFLEQNYLEYRQVPNSDPPRSEYLWGPRAHAETTKMKALEILAKLSDTVPSAFPALYEEALRDEEERATARSAARIARLAKASAPSKAKSHGFSYI